MYKRQLYFQHCSDLLESLHTSRASARDFTHLMLETKRNSPKLPLTGGIGGPDECGHAFVVAKLLEALEELEQLVSELAAKKASVKSLSARLSAEKAANGELQSTIVDQRRAWKVAATLRWSGRHGHMADINSPRPLETSLLAARAFTCWSGTIWQGGWI